MPMAFVFMNIDTGGEQQVLDQLRGITNVKEAYLVYGVYDLVARIEAQTMDELKEIVTWKVRRLDKVRSTLTTIVMESG
jgi:DNA-binding Lrp family transcriptional regulator